MKKLWIFSAVFLLAGVIMLLVPIHMQPTGAVLLLLGNGMGIPPCFGGIPPRKNRPPFKSLPWRRLREL